LPFGIQSIKAKLDFPEPESPVITTNLFLGMATSTFFRLCTCALYDDIFLGSNVERSTCKTIIFTKVINFQPTKRLNSHKIFKTTNNSDFGYV
jgi:hypothetical protein